MYRLRDPALLLSRRPAKYCICTQPNEADIKLPQCVFTGTRGMTNLKGASASSVRITYYALEVRREKPSMLVDFKAITGHEHWDQKYAGGERQECVRSSDATDWHLCFHSDLRNTISETSQRSPTLLHRHWSFTRNETTAWKCSHYAFYSRDSLLT